MLTQRQQARKAYDEATAAVWEAYDEAAAPAREAREEVIAAAWKTYNEAMAPAQRARDKAIALAETAYDEAIAPAEAYDEAVAKEGKHGKSIKIEDETYKQLQGIQQPRESYDDIIARLIRLGVGLADLANLYLSPLKHPNREAPHD